MNPVDFCCQVQLGKLRCCLSGSHQINVIICVYGFSLITSVDSRVVGSLTSCPVETRSTPSTKDLILYSSGHIPQPTRRCQSRSVYDSITNPFLVEPAGIEPASKTAFGSLHTTITSPRLPGPMDPGDRCSGLSPPRRLDVDEIRAPPSIPPAQHILLLISLLRARCHCGNPLRHLLLGCAL
jgi:hypothetical protein